MRIYLICKRYYTNKDLIKERFGRLYHLPKEWAANGAEVWVNAIDYREKLLPRLCAQMEILWEFHLKIQDCHQSNMALWEV